MNQTSGLEDKYFQTHYAHFLDGTADEYNRQARMHRFVYGRFLPKDPTARIVDIGCGMGHFLYFLKQAGYQNISGIDRSEDQLALCRTHVAAPVWNCDALAFLQEHPGEFDLITAHHFIEHQPLDAAMTFVGAMYGALKPGGYLVLSTPNAGSPWACYSRYGDLTHHLLFSDLGFLQLFATLGIDHVELYPDRGAPIDFPSAVRWTLGLLQEQLFKLSLSIAIGRGRGRGDLGMIVSGNLIAAVTKR